MCQASRAGDLAIDFSQKELYLSDADFITVFKMTRVRGWVGCLGAVPWLPR